MLGLRAASDQTSLQDDLRREQLLLIKAWKLPLGASEQRTLPLSDEASLNEQLSILLSRGVTLVEALEVASSVVGPATQARVARLREFVAAGASFSEACAKVGGFDAVTVSVYRSAERSGDLSGSAKRLAVAARRRLAIKGKAVTVLIYPSVVFGFASIIFIGVLTFLVPMIATQIRQMKVKTNPYSQAVFDLGEWMNAHMALTFGAIAAVLVAAFFARRQLIDALLRGLSRFPAVSRLLVTVEMTRFFSVMAAMVKSGVPLADALATSVGVITSDSLRTQLQSLQRGLVEGGVWRTLVEKVAALPLSTRRLLVAAERAGDLDSAFDSLAEEMAHEVDTRSSRLLALLEPLAILLMFALIGPLLLAIAIPLLTFRSQV